MAFTGRDSDWSKSGQLQVSSMQTLVSMETAKHSGQPLNQAAINYCLLLSCVLNQVRDSYNKCHPSAQEERDHAITIKLTDFAAGLYFSTVLQHWDPPGHCWRISSILFHLSGSCIKVKRLEQFYTQLVLN